MATGQLVVRHDPVVRRHDSAIWKMRPSTSLTAARSCRTDNSPRWCFFPFSADRRFPAVVLGPVLNRQGLCRSVA
jgi:hypothetical protein